MTSASGTSLTRIRDKRRIYNHLVACGTATCDEVEIALGMPHQTASARFFDLRALNWIAPTGETRATRTGSPALVWRPLPEEQHRAARTTRPPLRVTRYYAAGLTDLGEWITMGPYYTPEARTAMLAGITFTFLLLLMQSRHGVLTIQEPP